jgi:hypothetical protein
MASNPVDDISSADTSGAPALDSAPGRDDGMAGAGQAFFALLFGFGFVLCGVVLAAGPRLSWKIDQISRGFAYLGVHGGTLIVGGILLAAIGLVLRAQSLAAETAGTRDEVPMLEGLTSDVLQMHNSLDHLARCVDSFETKMERVAKDVRELEFKFPRPEPAPAAPPEPALDEGQKDAIFRLAASVDHLGARIDQRLKAQYKELYERLEEINALVSKVCAETHTRGELGCAPGAALPHPQDEANLGPLLADERLGRAIEDMRRQGKG